MIHISFTIHDYIELWLATANYTRSIDIHIVKMANIHNKIEEYPSRKISKSLIYNCINIIFKREKKKNEKEIEENIFHVFFLFLNCWTAIIYQMLYHKRRPWMNMIEL